MPYIQARDIRIRYRFDGPADAPVLLLSNSLGTRLEMWEPQVEAFARRFRVLRYDTRGHGDTQVTPGPYGIPALAEDVLALLDALDIPVVRFCGLSMGGMIGLWLAVHASGRVQRLVLANTAAKIGTAELWNARIEAVRRDGMAKIIDAVLGRWFTPSFLTFAPESVEAVRQMLLASDPQGYCACCAAVRDVDQRQDLAGVSVPTLVIAGRQDQATPAAEGRYLAEGIPHARYLELPTAHLSNVEAAEAFSSGVLAFLER